MHDLYNYTRHKHAQVKDSNGGSNGIHVTGQGHMSLFSKVSVA